MNRDIPRYFTEARVAAELGLPVEEVGRASKEMGLGRVELAGNEVKRYFTVEEMNQINVWAASIPRPLLQSARMVTTNRTKHENVSATKSSDDTVGIDI